MKELYKKIALTILLIFISLKPCYAVTSEDVYNELEKHFSCVLGDVSQLVSTHIVNTCIKEDLVSYYGKMFFGTIESGGMYPLLGAILRMNVSYLEGNTTPSCKNIPYSLDYLITGDPADKIDSIPTLKYGLCNESMLHFKQLEIIASSILNAFGSLFTDNYDSFTANLVTGILLSNLHPQDYVTTKNDSLGHSGWISSDYVTPLPTPGVGFPLIPYKIIQQDDKICVGVINLFSTLDADSANDLSWIPVGCRYLEEPFKVSLASLLPEVGGCGKFGDCVDRAKKYSQSTFALSNVLIHCISETASRVLLAPSDCSSQGIGTDFPIGLTSSKIAETLQQEVTILSPKSLFHNLQLNMRKIVQALLTLYIMFYCMRLYLMPEQISQREVVKHIFMVFIVAYFSIGIYGKSGKIYNGSSEFFLPIILNASQALSTFLFSMSNVKGLCEFSGYPSGLEYFAMWDSIDCRIGFYLGSSLVQLVSSGPALPLLAITVPAIIAGQLLFIIVSFIFVILVISVLVYIVSNFITCTIFICIVSFLSPVFIPMVLFESTKPMFKKWIKVLIALALQPVIGVAFLSMMFSIFDYVFFKNCEFYSINITQDYKQIGGTDRSILSNHNFKYFVIKEPTDASADQKKLCRSSIGWKIAPQKLLDNLRANFSPGSTVTSARLNEISDKIGFKFGDGFDDIVSNIDGAFLTLPTLNVKTSMDLVGELLVVCIFMLLFYHLSANLSSIAQEISGTSGSDLSAQATANKAISAINDLRAKAASSGNQKKT